jgi:hypothetical protein
VWFGLTWLIYEPVAGSYEHNNERLDSIKAGEFLDYICDY